ncbi:MAG: Mn transporter [Deltaproteobacteria bacterium CG11_big_fil_rev_8_21_14_0_20_47_16]|nr:MAG: Mn transporter [Deltaproteobacteria bacterium CG11_big_fil_rev_8_21_14_0_20_47_16]
MFKKISWKNILMFLAILGPGLITANVDNDAGGIATYSIAGAEYGYGFLWSILPVTIVLIIMQEMSVRMGAVTGKGLADLIRERFGLKITFYFMLALFVTNIGNVVAEFAGVASSLGIFGVSKYISVPLSALFVWILVVKGSYKSVEKIFLVACLFYVAYPLSGYLANPNWHEVGIAMVSPSVQWDSAWFYMLVGIVGTSVAPWMQFYLQSAVVEKGVDAEHYRHSRLDVIIGCVMASVVIFFIVLACAATLHPVGIHVDDAADAALALRPFAGKYASMLFSFGLLNASVFAASILPLSTAYTICEGLGFETGVNKTFKEAPQFYGLYTAIIIIGALSVLWPKFPFFLIMLFSQVLNGVLLPFVLFFMLKLINNREIMGEYVNSRKMNIISWSSAVIIMVLSLVMVVLAFIQ